MIAAAGIARRSFAVAAFGASVDRNSAPASSALRIPAKGERFRCSTLPVLAPLCRITLWYNPSAPGKAISSVIDCAPALSPNTVTLPGSPPNAEMLSRTQTSAAAWSIRP